MFELLREIRGFSVRISGHGIVINVKGKPGKVKRQKKIVLEGVEG